MLNRLRRDVAANPYDTVGLIRRLLTGTGRQHWKRYATAVALMSISAGCTASTAYLIGVASNEAYIERSFQGLAAVAIATMVVFIVKGLSTYGQAVILARISNRIVAENQRRMIDKLLQQNLSFYQDRHSSEFTARITYGASSTSAALNMLFMALGRDALTLFGLVVVMVTQAPFMALIALVVMPPAVIFVRHLVKRVRAVTRTQFSGGANILQALQEIVQGMRVVKALNLEEEFRRRVHNDVQSVERASNKLARISNRSAPLMETLGGLAIGWMLIYGGYRMLVVGTPPGELVSFITAFLLAYEPAKRIAKLNIDLSNVLVGVQMVFEVFDLPDDANDAEKPKLNVTRGEVEFAEVSSSYRLNQPVLRGMSFKAKPSGVTALIGPSGGGKTTILNLVLRLYEVDAGAILIDGQNIAAVSRTSLRENIAYVGQDVFLFRGTIRENIAFGRIGASDDDIVAAAKDAYAHDFIMEFPSGYDTPVGEHGMQLSGGQRQRIAVARALIRNSPIILLDEPTASLDSESEHHVREAISRLFQNRTTIVIAHRLHTVTNADMIHVVENGTIVESGRHESLMREGKRYADIYRLQFSEE